MTARAVPEEGSPCTLLGKGATSHRLPILLPVTSLATSVPKYTGAWLAVYLRIKTIKSEVHSHRFSSHLSTIIPVQTAPLSSRPMVDSLLHISCTVTPRCLQLSEAYTESLLFPPPQAHPQKSVAVKPPPMGGHHR